jgi:hypothetical protein
VLLVVKAIAEACGIEIFAQKGQDYSFFSSPYQAHRDYAAIDIRAGKNFGCEILSPVSGIVLKVLSYESPTPTGTALPEHLIMLKKGGHVARMMHVAPMVSAGDVIHVGDVIGRSIANGFFAYWNDPTVHVEIRRENDYIRAKGGIELKPLEEARAVEVRRKTKKLSGIVTAASSHNVTVKLENAYEAKAGETRVHLDGTTNIDYAGIIGRFPVGEPVYLNGTKIGEITCSGSYASTYRNLQVNVLVNGIRFAGLAFTNDRMTIRLLPERYGDTGLKKGDKAVVHISVI